MGCCATLTHRRIWDGYPLVVFIIEVAVTLAIWGTCIGLIVKLPSTRAYAGIALAITLFYITRLWRILPGERRRVRRAVSDRVEDLLAEMPLRCSPQRAALPPQASAAASQRRQSPAYLTHEPFGSVASSCKSSFMPPCYYMPPSPTAAALPPPPYALLPPAPLGQSSRRALPPPLVPMLLDQPGSTTASLRQFRSPAAAAGMDTRSPRCAFDPSPSPLPWLSCGTSRRPSYAAREPFASTASMRAASMGLNNSQCLRSYKYYPYRQ